MATSALTIFVVEDEPLILLATIGMLEGAGFAVRHETSAERAINTLERYHETIAVAFLDIEMPVGQLNGLELASIVRERWPSIGIALTSGGVNPTEGSLPAGALFFGKPYTDATVLEGMRRLCSERRTVKPMSSHNRAE